MIRSWWDFACAAWIIGEFLAMGFFVIVLPVKRRLWRYLAQSGAFDAAGGEE